MTSFAYTVLDNTGKEKQGTINATDAREAANQLRARSLFVVDIKEGEQKKSRTSGGKATKGFLRFLSPSRYLAPGIYDRSLFFRQMALMLRSGYTVVQALDACSELTGKLRLERTLDRMADSIRKGANFSSAVAEEKKTFSKLEAQLVASGEHGGDLSPILERLSQDLSRRREVQRQFMVSMIYPAFLVIIGGGVLYFLVTTVIPKFADFLTGRGEALPPTTQFLLDVSGWFVTYGPTLLGSIGIVTFSLLVAYTTATGKRAIDKILIRFPVIGKTTLIAGMAQAGWTMGMLLRSGVTVLDSLRMTASVMNNQALADVFESSANQILSGRSLANALNQSVLPLLMQHMAAVGERSGQLEQVMEESGEFYRKELTARISTLTEWMVPVAVLIIAVPVGLVYYAFFSALLAVSGAG
ncbi:MAG: type II secretion system F family protein [Candidatus Nitronauta litoralis]|uniref:Type II secretion system F family protein n=1 Tax=Candidatus Nitronauta litoralis TaxID=2705533 RepID=A0A7T0BXU9_9BACT|nr:MAG: type II secretion system F family protein [Candidatus Nitronauta litoralis]